MCSAYQAERLKSSVQAQGSALGGAVEGRVRVGGEEGGRAPACSRALGPPRTPMLARLATGKLAAGSDCLCSRASLRAV